MLDVAAIIEDQNKIVEEKFGPGFHYYNYYLF